MDADRLALFAILLFAASEIVGLNPKLKENSVLQLVLKLLLNAFRPYLPKDPNR